MLFSGTIRENIAYGNPSATDTEIVEAAEAAFALDFIERLPGAFDGGRGTRSAAFGGRASADCHLPGLFEEQPDPDFG